METVKDRETGFLMEKNDPRQTAEALLTLLGNDSLRESMGSAARQHVLDHFTWDRVATGMYARYQTLCSANPSSQLQDIRT